MPGCVGGLLSFWSHVDYVHSDRIGPEVWMDDGCGGVATPRAYQSALAVVAPGIAKRQDDAVIGIVFIQALAPVVIAEPVFKPLLASFDLLEVFALEGQDQFTHGFASHPFSPQTTQERSSSWHRDAYPLLK